MPAMIIRKPVKAVTAASHYLISAQHSTALRITTQHSTACMTWQGLAVPSQPISSLLRS